MDGDKQCSTLNAMESNNSLSGKKGKKKMVYKSVLIPPLPIPLNRIKLGDSDFQSILTKELSEIPKEKTQRKHLALGANAVYRELQKNNLEAVLFAEDIQPASLVAHVITAAAVKNVALLKVKNLRDITKTAMGFECISIGFKKPSQYFTNSISSIKQQQNSPKDPQQTQTEIHNLQLANQLSLKDSKTFSKKRPFQYAQRGSPFIPEIKNPHPSSATTDFIEIILDDDYHPLEKKQKSVFIPAATKKVAAKRK